ncbi:subclass B3 metallo-beta-lactamase [Microbulbifer sp.]|uniref:subclass B3 metallo-beta-lactamase n=1 Tax=Microbulbifer sp. TaxID=1908541 RepID=UPI0025844383|nr:subclass B3 metallo-beta-lactamase [Microbulbifer sp.]
MRRLKHRVRLLPLLVSVFFLSAVSAETALPQLQAYEVPADWRTPVKPLQIADQTWQIGSKSLTALLVKTGNGAVLIDGGMPQMAEHLLSNMQALDVAPEDLKWILHSHGHADHAGPLAAIKNASAARIASNAESSRLLARGGAGDLHFDDGLLFPSVSVDRYLQDGEQIVLGEVTFTVHFIPGHTPGSMAWTWRDSLNGQEIDIAYVDSLTAPGYQLIGNVRYPNIVADFHRSFDRISALPCDLLLTPHPHASGWTYGDKALRKKSVSCSKYTENAQRVLQEQLNKQEQQIREINDNFD